MVDLGGIDKILRTLESNASTLGAIYGFIQDPTFGERGLTGAPAFMIDRVLHWKIPNPEKILWYLRCSEAYSAFRMGIVAAIAGYVLQAIDMHDTVTRIGGLMKNLGTGAAIGSGLGALIWLPAINPSGSSGGSGSFSTGWGH